MLGHQTFTVRTHSEGTTRVEHQLGGHYWTKKKLDAPENTQVILFVKEFNDQNKTIDSEWSMKHLYREKQTRNFKVSSISKDEIRLKGNNGDNHIIPNGPDYSYPFVESDMGKIIALPINKIFNHNNLLEFDINGFVNLRKAIVPYYINTDLRQYQIKAKVEIYDKWKRGLKSVLLQMPTGTGKTRLFCSMVREFHIASHKDDIRRVLLVAHREELILQIRDTLSKNFGLKAGIIKNGYEEEPKIPIQIASIQTLKNRELTRIPSLVIIDEAHHAKAETYLDLWKRFPEAYFLGVTATPYRLTGEGFTDLFDALITTPSISQFTEDGFLAPIKYYAVKEKRKFLSLVGMKGGDYKESDLEEFLDTEKSRNILVRTYQELAEGKKGLVYCVTKKHSKFVKEAYRNAGVPAEHIDGDTPPEIRKEIISRFIKGHIKVLCNVDIFSEGFDCPDIEFVQLARPTKSLSKYLQQIGRCTRTHASKLYGIILDNVGNQLENGIFNHEWDWDYYFRGYRVDVLDSENLGFGNSSREWKLEEEDDNLELILDPGIEETDPEKQYKENFEISFHHFLDQDLKSRYKKIHAIGYSEDEVLKVLNLLHPLQFEFAESQFMKYQKSKSELEKFKNQRIEFEQEIIKKKIELSESIEVDEERDVLPEFPNLHKFYSTLKATGQFNEFELQSITKHKMPIEYELFLKRKEETIVDMSSLQEDIDELSEKIEMVDEQIFNLNEDIFQMVEPLLVEK
jgi:superfamily II DNA or RNA helicase/methyl coenzyme M reductase subunit D